MVPSRVRTALRSTRPLARARSRPGAASWPWSDVVATRWDRSVQIVHRAARPRCSTSPGAATVAVSVREPGPRAAATTAVHGREVPRRPRSSRTCRSTVP